MKEPENELVRRARALKADAARIAAQEASRQAQLEAEEATARQQAEVLKADLQLESDKNAAMFIDKMNVDGIQPVAFYEQAEEVYWSYSHEHVDGNTYRYAAKLNVTQLGEGWVIKEPTGWYQGDWSQGYILLTNGDTYKCWLPKKPGHYHDVGRSYSEGSGPEIKEGSVATNTTKPIVEAPYAGERSSLLIDAMLRLGDV